MFDFKTLVLKMLDLKSKPTFSPAEKLLIFIDSGMMPLQMFTAFIILLKLTAKIKTSAEVIYLTILLLWQFFLLDKLSISTLIFIVNENL